MSSQIHVNDVGTTLIGTVLDSGVAVDISSASSIQMLIKKPDQTTLTKTASFNSDGTDGKMKYVTISGDIDQAGNYKIQGKVVLGTATYFSSVSTFKVYCNL
ncbi:MAG: hypothetical protein CMC15_15910 [Flavobacteriaceae bacterium]|jgi:hypothetical protein|nr:hypothetical protein [Flavobacteriaceae bacterium]MAR66959.1 hypothetical protein [Crocinitomicaceae bacterium]|tara:strand:- start:3262 stop:3567 length:306 start_codon:yes stop_codon:yes gene_type:complete